MEKAGKGLIEAQPRLGLEVQSLIGREGGSRKEREREMGG